jgi:hypothetical protein
VHAGLIPGVGAWAFWEAKDDEVGV